MFRITPEVEELERIPVKEKEVTVNDVLDKAVEILENEGWTAGLYHNPEDGSYCAVGAIREAAVRLNAARLYSRAHHLANRAVYGMTIICFNDHQAGKRKGKQRVIAKLKKAKTVR